MATRIRRDVLCTGVEAECHCWRPKLALIENCAARMVRSEKPYSERKWSVRRLLALRRLWRMPPMNSPARPIPATYKAVQLTCLLRASLVAVGYNVMLKQAHRHSKRTLGGEVQPALYWGRADLSSQ
jgi:hypothetical protein